MKNKDDKIEKLGQNSQQIKVNLRPKNNNISYNQVPIYSDYSPYYNYNQKELTLEEMKNVKHHQYLEPNTYNNSNVFTEYNSIPKYSINSPNLYQIGNLKNIKNNYNNITTTENYTNKLSDRQRMVNPVNSINQNKNVKIGTKLNVYKSEIQYPINFSKEVPRNKNIYKIYNNTNSKEDNNEDEYSKDVPNKVISKNKKNEIGNYYISSPNKKANKKGIRHNKSNVDLVNRRKNKEIDYSEYSVINQFSAVKNSNYNTYSKNENDIINYNSCYNFYQKGNRIKSHNNNDINKNMHNPMNSIGYLNTISNSAEGNKYSQFYNHINNANIYENENGSYYIDFINQDFKKNNKKFKNIGTSADDYDDMNMNMHLNEPRHSRGQKSAEIFESFNNREFEFNNILDINKFIQYKKKLLEEFCHCLEEFIFINVKNNFDSFIFKLREYCKEKYFNSLLLKRLKNKNIKKNFYKERPSSSNKYLNPKSSNPFYSIIMNNTNIDVHRNNDYILNDLSKGRKSVYDFGKKNIFIEEESPILSKNYRTGKSHDKYNLNYNTAKYNNYYINDFYYNINHYDYDYNNINDLKKDNIYVDKNLYIPKKFNTTKNTQLPENRKVQQKNKNPFYYRIEGELIGHENEVNKSHDIGNNNIKMKNNYNNIKNISYDNKYNIKKNIENGLLSQTNNSVRGKKNINKKKDNLKQVYKKKIKITKTNSKIFRPKPINNNYKEKNNKIKEKILKEENINLSNKKRNGNKKEEIDNVSFANNINEIEQYEEFNHILNENNIIKNEIITNHNGNINEINKSNIQEKYNEINNDVSGNISNDISNDNFDNGMSNKNNIIDEDSDESDENITREIIVKDVSTRDKKLNVYIKYIEMSKTNKKTNNFSQHHSLSIFQTDSFYLKSSYNKKNNYFNKYYYGNSNDKNNKLKLHKILSSIIEEEEKSKAAGSVNNSIISEEDNYNNGNYSHFYIQTIKYVTNFLQSIMDDKKKDISFQFFKILKRIKNDSFLKGLINQKKLQALNKYKDNNDEEENENNTSGDVILYNVNMNDNFNIDINNFGSKSNDRKDISNIRRKNTKNAKNKKEKRDDKIIKYIKEKLDNDITILDKKYSSANNFYPKYIENLEINVNNNINLSIYNYDINENKKNKELNFSFSKNETNTKHKLFKEFIEHIDKAKNDELIRNFFKKWKNIKKEKKQISELHLDDEKKEEDNFINIDYDKNVTISEACRGLSDVIFDFKLYLVKYCLKNKNEYN